MDDIRTDDRLRVRADLNRYWLWILLEANRWALAIALSLGVFLVFLLFGLLKSVPLRTTMASSDMVESLFAGMVGAVITVTTLVVTINQLVLSQEIGSLGNQRTRMDETLDVRNNTAELLGRTTPADPAAYLRELVETTERRAAKLNETLAGEGDGDGNDDGDGAGDDDFQERVDVYVADLLENADHALARLEDTEFGTFDVLSPALDYNYSRKLYDVQRLADERDAALTSEQRAAFDDLLTAIAMYGVVRDYVKNLYIQWALVKLSRSILYATVVALIVAGGMVVFVDASTFPGTLFGVEQILLVVSAAFALSTLPFMVFTAYILRLATIAKQTLSMGPLVLRE